MLWLLDCENVGRGLVGYDTITLWEVNDVSEKHVASVFGVDAAVTTNESQQCRNTGSKCTIKAIPLLHVLN
jgi:diaminopimelate decarboxylase